MNTLKRLMLFAALGLTLASCGLLTSNERSSTRTFPNQDEAQEFFSRSTVSCQGLNCPSYVGGLYTHSDKDVSACSMTLISENTVLTNKHCVPNNLQYEGASCGNRMRMTLPQTALHAEESFECDEIVSLAGDYSRKGVPDWAIIRLVGSTSRTPIKLDASGVENDKEVILYPIYFDLNSSGRSHGEARRVDCRANTNMYYSDKQAGPLSALLNISHCSNDLMVGNSGTGIASANNELIGVYSFGPSEEGLESIQREYPYMTESFGGGTNLHCIFPLSGVEGGECAFDYDGSSYYEIASTRESGRWVMAGSNYDRIGDQIMAETGEANGIQYSRFTPELLENFDFVSFQDSFLEVKRDSQALWLEILFPAVPTCIDRSFAEASVEIPVRFPLIGSGKISRPSHEATRESLKSDQEFDVVLQGDHLELSPAGSFITSPSLRSLLSIRSWDDLKLKVDFCR